MDGDTGREMIFRPKRVDANHKAIVAALRKIGACVIDLSGSGKGVMDIIVVHRAKWWAIEIKDGDKAPSRQGLTPAQIQLHALVGSAGGEIHIVRSVDAAIALLTNGEGHV